MTEMGVVRATGARPQSREKLSLTQRAALTFVSQVLAQGAALVTGLIVTPIVTRGLGQELYGAWAMMQRAVGFVGLGSLSSMTALKIRLGTSQHKDDLQEKRRLIGASLLLWTVATPLLLAIGACVVYFVPALIRAGTEHIGDVRLALLVMIASMIVGQIITMPGMLIAAHNMEYKAMGLNAIAILAGGMLNAVAIWAGFGLVGLAVSTLLGVALVSSCRYVVARKVLPWIGMALPLYSEFIAFTRLSLWATLSTLSGVILNAADLFLVGYLLDPSTAAVYSITGSALRMTTQPVFQLLQSGAGGYAMLGGKGDWINVARIRIEMHQIAITLTAVVATGVLALNGAFVSLWVGREYYGGEILTALMALLAVARLFFYLDILVVEMTLKLKYKVWATLSCGLAGLAVGVILIPRWNASGMAVGSLLSYCLLILYVPFVIRRLTGIPLREYARRMARPIVTALVCLLGGYYFALRVHPATWRMFAVASLAVGLTTFGVMVVIGLPAEGRRNLYQRIKRLAHREAGAQVW